MPQEEGAVRAKGRAIVKALRLLADETHKPLAMDSKEDRIRLQKLVYLLKAGGYPPAMKFDFNLYQNGPYSPELTQVYYLYGTDGIADSPAAKDVRADLLATLKEADSKGVLFLEALATALDTSTSLRRKSGANSEFARGLTWARSIKPQIDERTWQEVRVFLRTHSALAGSI
jgi:hypothetical protein